MNIFSVVARKSPVFSKLESQLVQRTKALETLTQQLLRVQDDERRKVARDLHDSAGQTLTAVKLSLAALEKTLEQDRSANSLLAEIDALVDQALKEIRTTSYLLHPPLLDEAGFAAAARWYVTGFANRSGIDAKCEITAETHRLPRTIETAFFRVLQESLLNVYRHSGSSEVWIRFEFASDGAVLEITDDGRGMSAEVLERLREASAEAGVGLAGMRERLNELNGKLEIESGVRGTCLRATIPLAAVSYASGFPGAQVTQRVQQPAPLG